MNKFAFLVHPRHSAREDMGKVSPFFLLFPEFILKKIITFLGPIKAGRVKFENNKTELIGWIVWIPLLGEQILTLPKKIVIVRLVKAIKMMKDLGAKVIGLGEFTASVTHGGRDLVGLVEGVSITSGNSLTTGVVFRAVEKIIEIKKINTAEAQVAIVGAAGSIGQGVAELLIQRGLNVLLVDRPQKSKKLEKRFFSYPKVRIETDTASIKYADISVIATSSMDQLIRADHLKQNAIIYDITQPRNTSPELLKKRPDATIIDGGIVNVPSIDFGVNIGLKRHQAYACLAETMLLAMDENKNNYVGFTTPELARKMLKLMDKYSDQFKIDIYHSFGKKLNGNLILRE